MEEYDLNMVCNIYIILWISMIVNVSLCIRINQTLCE